MKTVYRVFDALMFTAIVMLMVATKDYTLWGFAAYCAGNFLSRSDCE